MAIQTYVPIATYTVTSGQPSYTFSNIPQTYTDLIIECSYYQSSPQNDFINFNTDTIAAATTNYGYENAYVRGVSTQGATYANSQGSILASNYTNAGGSGTPASKTIQIGNYTSTTAYKPVLIRAGIGLLSGGNPATEMIYGYWRNNAAINTIILTSQSSNWNSGSIFTLYGLKGA